MVDYIKALQYFQQLRADGMAWEPALTRTCDFIGLDYDQDEDDICNVKAFLTLNDVVRDFEE